LTMFLSVSPFAGGIPAITTIVTVQDVQVQK
jgi:hypothetical protein